MKKRHFICIVQRSVKSLKNVGSWTVCSSLVLSFFVGARHRESRPQEGGGTAQAWTTWPEGASAPNGTVNTIVMCMCCGHGVSLYPK